jgi:hypothetical protein
VLTDIIFSELVDFAQQFRVGKETGVRVWIFRCHRVDVERKCKISDERIGKEKRKIEERGQRTEAQRARSPKREKSERRLMREKAREEEEMIRER